MVVPKIINCGQIGGTDCSIVRLTQTTETRRTGIGIYFSNFNFSIMKFSRTFFLLFLVFSFSACMDDDAFDPNDPAATIQGSFTGTLTVNGTPTENYTVDLKKQTNNTVMLSAVSLPDLVIELEANQAGEGIFGTADSVANLNYLVNEQTLQFLLEGNGFRNFAGVKD